MGFTFFIGLKLPNLGKSKKELREVFGVFWKTNLIFIILSYDENVSFEPFPPIVRNGKAFSNRVLAMTKPDVRIFNSLVFFFI